MSSASPNNVKILNKGSYTKAELKTVAHIHAVAFPGFFLTFLGEGFLYHLYKGYVTHAPSGLIVAEDNNKIIGFAAYSFSYDTFFKFLIKKSLLPFMLYSGLAFIKKPKVMMRLIRAFLKSDDVKRKEKYMELSSIGVDPSYKGKGIGTKLITEIKNSFPQGEYKYISLETDKLNNDRVNAFYVKNGFVLERSYFTREGREMNEYRYYPGE